MQPEGLPQMSEAEEMYLITAARLLEDGQESPVALSALAQARSLNAASVNQMVRKLADTGMVNYLPYKGIELTSLGHAVASRILRYRRLWEVFLVQKLQMTIGDADNLACRLEHLTSEDVADRLSRFLGEPSVSPQGKRIPPRQTAPEDETWLPLAQIPVGRRTKVASLQGDPVSRAFLGGEGLVPGCQITILAVGGDGAVLVDVGGRAVNLSPALAGGILTSGTS